LEEVFDDLKDMISAVHTHQPIQVVLNESTIKKKSRCKKYSSLDVNFTNKTPGRLLSRKLRNQQCDNEKLTPVNVKFKKKKVYIIQFNELERVS
jgi:hypothetical protein